MNFFGLKKKKKKKKPGGTPPPRIAKSTSVSELKNVVFAILL